MRGCAKGVGPMWSVPRGYVKGCRVEVVSAVAKLRYARQTINPDPGNRNLVCLVCRGDVVVLGLTGAWRSHGVMAPLNPYPEDH